MLEQFKNSVGIKFQLYNSLFTSLPFHRIEKTGVLLSLLLTECEEGYKKRHSPQTIIENFFKRYTNVGSEAEKADLLFRFVQYVERQVVLFDALEDAAFTEINDVHGAGTIKHLAAEVQQKRKEKQLHQKLKNFKVHIVLTAHPTQFYPGTVLGIINDLSSALKDNNAGQVNMYLQQLGKTPFYNKQKPTPYDEAVSLIWYLENVFYKAVGKIVAGLKAELGIDIMDESIISMGFWPGGDRDGNPNVSTDTTLKVADALRTSIIKCYYREVRQLKRRLTFENVDVILAGLEKKLYDNIFIPEKKTNLTSAEIFDDLNSIRDIIVHQHNGLFLHLVDDLINKVQAFGLHFASLDIRQESSVHNTVLEAIAAKEKCLPPGYAQLTDKQKIKALMAVTGTASPDLYDDALVKDTLESIKAVKNIQEYNGEKGCNRYVISQCNSAINVIEVYGLFLLNGWQKEQMHIDIVPLFETVDDLKHAPAIMQALYENEAYRQHLQFRNNTQTIMVGFSDGTKDGGYLMANWSIYKAKQKLTEVSKPYGVAVVFFDGRGGPPARGGGKTHKFYASMGKNISNKEIQLTVQGQTVSSNFGNIEAAQYNIEQLLHAGITNDLFMTKEKMLHEEEEALLEELADESLQCYIALKEHPYFLDYLSNVSPLKFYGETNIGSRPTKRGTTSKLSLKDLRAIPYVGAWSQLKQNIPGFYGVGTAIQALDKKGKLPQVKKLYQESLFFKTLIDNCEMAMKKCFFPLTAFLADHPKYGEIWNNLYQEFELTQRYLLTLSGKDLMGDYPVDQLSIQMREKIVLPLITIQQYGITCINGMDKSKSLALHKDALHRLVVRCSFGIINAGRNAV